MSEEVTFHSKNDTSNLVYVVRWVFRIGIPMTCTWLWVWAYEKNGTHIVVQDDGCVF
jgi:hypothetical protein